MSNPKEVIVKMSDGTRWRIPTNVIAFNRTAYYSIKDGFTLDSEMWKNEYKASMDESELLDWLQNNMNWEDVSAYATVMPNREIVDYTDGLMNGKKEFVYETD